MVEPIFAAMNETDVRETIVRPLLSRLGYSHGSPDASVRTEVTLRYAKAFLGRKNPKKDPQLVGRADYVCDAISFGRWVVEVKRPSENLTRDSAEQAYTYAAHPEIAAAYFMMTNGFRFELYEVGRTVEPVLSFDHSELEENFLKLSNLVSPVALKRRAHLIVPDMRKPLGINLPSKLEVIGGWVIYEDHFSDHPLLREADINGLQLPVTGGFVERETDGRIHAYLIISSANPLMPDVASIFGVGDDYDFYSSAEYISTDQEAPTIFQNLVEQRAEPGRMVRVLGLGTFPSPIGHDLRAFTETVGFVADHVFKGTMRLTYDIRFDGLTPFIRQALQPQLGHIPDSVSMAGGGRFEVRLRPSPTA